MEASDAQYHVQSTGGLGDGFRDGFPYFHHHDSVSALWSKKWRPLSAAGIYPFTDGAVADFDPVFEELVTSSGDDPAILKSPDDYVKPFFGMADRLTCEGEDALANGDRDPARRLFLRAAAVCRIGRFPVNRSHLSQVAWERGKTVYEKGSELLDPPSISVDIPFARADTEVGDVDSPIPAYLRVPAGRPPIDGWPVLLFVCGLDAYKTDHTPRTQQHVDRGFATLSYEIPGTGDCPAAPDDPSSPERLHSSVLDWVDAQASDRAFDTSKVVARGISTGGYYAFRMAHTHEDRLFAVVAQGGGAHDMFDPAWIRAQNQMEYPFALADALAYKFGYRDGDPAAALASFETDAQKFSLLESGVLSTPSCLMLVINGMEDSIFPVEDSLLVGSQGDKNDLVLRGHRGHMGNPGAEELLYSWIDDRIAGRP